MTHHKETEIQGYLTGDHECGLIHPEMTLPQRHNFDTQEEYQEAREEWDPYEDGLYLRDLLPEEAHEGRHYFVIEVTAYPDPDSRSASKGERP